MLHCPIEGSHSGTLHTLKKRPWWLAEFCRWLWEPTPKSVYTILQAQNQLMIAQECKREPNSRKPRLATQHQWPLWRLFLHQATLEDQGSKVWKSPLTWCSWHGRAWAILKLFLQGMEKLLDSLPLSSTTKDALLLGPMEYFTLWRLNCSLTETRLLCSFTRNFVPCWVWQNYLLNVGGSPQLEAHIWGGVSLQRVACE